MDLINSTFTYILYFKSLYIKLVKQLNSILNIKYSFMDGMMYSLFNFLKEVSWMVKLTYYQNLYKYISFKNSGHSGSTNYQF